ncbi:MAG: septum site-determining protein MinC [Caldilineaceae bacterium]
MDKLESLTQKGMIDSRKTQGSDGVANLVSALLDDVTVKKPLLTTATYPEANYASVNGESTSETVSAEQKAPTPAQEEAVVSHEKASSILPILDASVHHAATNGYASVKTMPEEPRKAQEPTVASTELPLLDALPSEKSASASQEVSAQPATIQAVSEEQSATEQPQLSPDPYQSDGMAINIKGRADGVIVEIGRGNWEILLEALRKRLDHAGGFFRGGNVALDLAERSLQESDLRSLCDLLVAHSMKPALVRTASDRTFQSALMLGLAGTLESKDGRPLETVQAASSNQEAQNHYVYRGALRSGQILKRRSHVLIVGDVNPGSEVIATGDILIWGRLRGTAHAGVEGDTRAIVAAFDIDPVQLRIADAIAVGSGAQSEQGYRWLWSRNSEKRPEVARLVNGQIIIEAWDEAKTGGSPILKRRR